MAAGSTYTPIASYTVSTAQASYTFSSISGSYTDLVLISNGSASTGSTATFQFNSDTGSNYSNTYVLGDGTSASSGRGANTTSAYSFYPLNAQFTAITSIQNYSNTTTYKTLLTRHSGAGNYALANVGLWRSTNAITSITVATLSGTFSVGFTFSLYGITAA